MSTSFLDWELSNVKVNWRSSQIVDTGIQFNVNWVCAIVLPLLVNLAFWKVGWVTAGDVRIWNLIIYACFVSTDLRLSSNRVIWEKLNWQYFRSFWELRLILRQWGWLCPTYLHSFYLDQLPPSANTDTCLCLDDCWKKANVNCCYLNWASTVSNLHGLARLYSFYLDRLTVCKLWHLLSKPSQIQASHVGEM